MTFQQHRVFSKCLAAFIVLVCIVGLSAAIYGAHEFQAVLFAVIAISYIVLGITK